MARFLITFPLIHEIGGVRLALPELVERHCSGKLVDRQRCSSPLTCEEGRAPHHARQHMIHRALGRRPQHSRPGQVSHVTAAPLEQGCSTRRGQTLQIGVKPEVTDGRGRGEIGNRPEASRRDVAHRPYRRRPREGGGACPRRRGRGRLPQGGRRTVGWCRPGAPDRVIESGAGGVGCDLLLLRLLAARRDMRVGAQESALATFAAAPPAIS